MSFSQIYLERKQPFRDHKNETVQDRRCENICEIHKGELKLKRNHPLTPGRGRTPRATLTMKKLLILLVGFAFVCSVKATVIADVIIEGLPVKVISPVKATRFSSSTRGKVTLLIMVPKGIVCRPVMALEWVEILAALCECDREIGYTCRISAGGN